MGEVGNFSPFLPQWRYAAFSFFLLCICQSTDDERLGFFGQTGLGLFPD